MLSFALLPPEINSTRMYTGPGAGPLLAAVAAWDALAAQLDSYVAGYAATVTELQTHNWSGPSAQAMGAAAAPFLRWANGTAAMAAQTAAQARAAAAAYEAAFAATVPPAAVTANRTLLATLVATNFLGQNTPAIAATEALYGEMWAQDAAAMYGYAAASSAAGRLTPPQQPPQTSNGGASLNPLQALTDAVLHPFSDVNTLTTIPQMLNVYSSVGTQGANWILTLSQMVGEAAKAAAKSGASGAAAAATAAETQAGGPAAVLARSGGARALGGLSVPRGWPTAAAVTEVAEAAAPVHRFVPANPLAAPPGARPLALGPLSGASQRRRGNLTFRMRDRRYQMPRPAVGG